MLARVAETDLNLVQTFLRRYATRSATRTAEQMSLTQPSVSHALRQLRKQFNDNMFSRSAGGLEPTERARQVYPLLRQAIEAVEATMSGVAAFDPETARRTFHIQATDLGEIGLLPPVLALITESAPGINLHVAPLNVEITATALRQGHADAVLATTRITADDIARQVLVDDVYCGIRSATHPRITRPPGLDEFLVERHIAVEASAGHRP
jgi:DNA-binding transcriptional LysR family regulator